MTGTFPDDRYHTRHPSIRGTNVLTSQIGTFSCYETMPESFWNRTSTCKASAESPLIAWRLTWCRVETLLGIVCSQTFPVKQTPNLESQSRSDEVFFLRLLGRSNRPRCGVERRAKHFRFTGSLAVMTLVPTGSSRAFWIDGTMVRCGEKTLAPQSLCD